MTWPKALYYYEGSYIIYQGKLTYFGASRANPKVYLIYLSNSFTF